MSPALLCCAAASTLALAASEFEFGTGSVDITPSDPIRLSGYAARKTEATSVGLPLFVKAFAISCEGKRALFFSIDNVGVSKEFRDEVVARLDREFHIPAERTVIFSSHTHSAPCLSNAIPNIFAEDIPSDQQNRINRYTRETIDNTLRAAEAAFQDLQRGRIFLLKGEVGFAANRRTPGGPVDHALSVLIARRQDGSLGAILANYACHCTTLQGNRNSVHGDWAGVAQQEIQKRNPGVTALISIGCGADANPNPRGELNHVNEHGMAMASEVQRLLREGPAVEITETLQCSSKSFALPYSPLPSRADWERRAQTPGIVGYHARKNLARLDRGESLPESLPYEVAGWTFGRQLTMLFLPGEVVVDYSLAIKREFASDNVWVSGYANWVPCYIPSARILQEGGYEAEDSLWYYDRPARLSPQTEPLILGAVRALLGHQ